MSRRNSHHHQPEYVREEYGEERVYNESPYTCERVSSGYYERPIEGGPYPNNYKRNERLGELGAVAAEAFSLYERHEAKTDPANAHRHKLEEEAAGLGAFGSAGYAFYEHREKEKFQDRFY